ncbi:MAG: element excision factor XisH family protein [Candidatus Poribacteria bacterium]
MPRKDIYHDTVKNALIKDGWTITHDPLTLSFGDKDIGAEQPIGAEKDGKKIAVEVKSFVGKSDVDDLEKAIGQYVVYRYLLLETEQERGLYMAVPEATFLGIFSGRLGQLIIKRQKLKLIVFNPSREVILQWIQ